MKTILIASSTFGENNKKPIKDLKKIGYKLLFNPYKRKITSSELKQIFLKNEIVGVIAGLEEYNYEILSNSCLKVISRLGSGLSNVDLKTAKKRKIKVTSTSDLPSGAVAELTVGMAINLSRKIKYMDENLKNNNWIRHYGNLIKNKNILIIGYGKIGKKVAKFFKLLGAKIDIYDPYLKNKNLKTISLSKGLRRSDIITIHASNAKRILGPKEIKQIKKGAILLNSSRGETICEDSIYKSLKNGKIESAWFDVFLQEPYKGKLSKLNNVILTPHISSYTVETRIQMETEAVYNLKKYI